MKKLALITFSSIFPLITQALDIQVEVSGMESNTGGLVLKVYNNADTWLSEDTVLTTRVELTADSGDVVAIPVSLEPGNYAFSVYHDANDNKKMDTNFIGIPSEPVGLSNDHRPKFGPPRFKKAVLDIQDNQSVQLRLQ